MNQNSRILSKIFFTPKTRYRFNYDIYIYRLNFYKIFNDLWRSLKNIVAFIFQRKQRIRLHNKTHY